MTKERWNYVYFSAGGFAVCLALFGVIIPALLIGVGISVCLWADRQKQRGLK